MKRFAQSLIVALAFVCGPQLALASDDCNDCARSKYWFVEVAGGGNCYVHYQRVPSPGYSARYFTPASAYKAIAKNPACYTTAQWLRQYDYIRRAVN